ncbi:hypothetical protein ABW19_dt0208761 [Dactylella cylindrospora]|nr:hypothetical protein ABW19_dt0208761 [Dactylella cylindrospora]
MPKPSTVDLSLYAVFKDDPRLPTPRDRIKLVQVGAIRDAWKDFTKRNGFETSWLEVASEDRDQLYQEVLNRLKDRERKELEPLNDLDRRLDKMFRQHSANQEDYSKSKRKKEIELQRSTGLEHEPSAPERNNQSGLRIADLLTETPTWLDGDL